MTKIRIATFNVENLLQRFDFYRYGNLTASAPLSILGVKPEDKNYMTLRQAYHVSLTDDSRQMTSQAIRDTQADVVCLQEVDGKAAIDDFHDQYLRKSTGVHYGWRRVVEGNDNRGIDVGVIAKNRISVTSHAHHTFDDFDLFNDELRDYGLSEGDEIFRRDCLQVDLKVEGTDLTLFVCHFKSMSGGRERTMVVRRAEAAAVRRIITDLFQDPADARWLVVGDLNDYTQDDTGRPIENGLQPLLDHDFSVDLVKRRPLGDQWTHYWATEQVTRQLDYILASPRVANENDQVVPDIIRGGQPYRTPCPDARYPRIGFDRPKASDHSPVAVTLELP